MRSPGRAFPPLPRPPPAAASELAASGSTLLFPPPSRRPPLRPQPRPRSAPGRRQATAPPRGPEGDAAREPDSWGPRAAGRRGPRTPTPLRHRPEPSQPTQEVVVPPLSSRDGDAEVLRPKHSLTLPLSRFLTGRSLLPFSAGLQFCPPTTHDLRGSA